MRYAYQAYICLLYTSELLLTDEPAVRNPQARLPQSWPDGLFLREEPEYSPEYLTLMKRAKFARTS